MRSLAVDVAVGAVAAGLPGGQATAKVGVGGPAAGQVGLRSWERQLPKQRQVRRELANPRPKPRQEQGMPTQRGNPSSKLPRRQAEKKKGDCKDGDKPGGDKPAGDKPGGDKPAGGKPAGGKPTGSKPAGRKPAVEKRASESSFATPRKAARIREHDEGMAFASPGPVNAGKFVNSTKRRAHEKRQQVAALAMGKLKTACLPCLSIPPEPFTKQSFTVRDPNKNPYASNIGVVLKATSFYVAPATIPEDLREFIHLDNKGGCTVGWTVFPSLSIARLGF